MTGEEHLRTSLRRVAYPEWLRDRVSHLNEVLAIYRRTLHRLEIALAKYGPIEQPGHLLEARAELLEQIQQAEQELAVLRSGWQSYVDQLIRTET